MRTQEVLNYLEEWAPLALQESYDNSGLLVGDRNATITGVLVSLDCTEDVVEEAIAKNCNLIVSHHPVIFGGLKRLTGDNYVQRTVIKAIKNDIQLYAIHTNLDNIPLGVNGEIASRLGLRNTQILLPKTNVLYKLVVFCPPTCLDAVREGIFAAGGGHVGNYSECAFELEGTGSFKPEPGANPSEGEIGKRYSNREFKLEVIVPAWLKGRVWNAVIENHPYETIAHEWLKLEQPNQEIGSGMIGELEQELPLSDVLALIKNNFNTKVLKHTESINKPIKRIAVCGGSGQFLLEQAKREGADLYLTSDVKYHEFFDTEGKLVLVDMGHYESEQFTIELIANKLAEKFRTFAVHKTAVVTNPVYYY
jgi:dinuclear metal center YbgI/SA1388 family protein